MTTQDRRKGDYDMYVYRKRSSQPFKWVLAAIIFVVGLCMTFSQVM